MIFFLFLFIVLGGVSKKILLWLMSKSVFPVFSSKNFIVCSLTFRSLIHFEFIFVHGVRECSDFILLHVAFPAPLIEEAVFSPYSQYLPGIFLPPLSKRRRPYLTSGIYILSCWSIFLFLCQYHAVLVTVALYYSLKSESQLHFSVSRLLWLFGVFCISIQIIQFFVLIQ